jgi:hypothetical protein
LFEVADAGGRTASQGALQHEQTAQAGRHGGDVSSKGGSRGRRRDAN